MSFRTCCVQDCFARSADGGAILHCFPNPNTELERFQSWITKIGGEVMKLDHNYVYKNRRICRKHFDTVYHGSKNRLCKTAVPTLHLPDVTFDVPVTPKLLESSTPVASTSGTSKYHMSHVMTTVPRESGLTLDVPVTPKLLVPRTPVASTSGTSKDYIMSHAMIAVPRESGKHKVLMTVNEIKMKKMIMNLKKEVHRNKMTKESFRQRLMLAHKSAKHDAMKHIGQKMTKAAKIFLDMQIKEAGKKAKGRRFSLEEKILALSLYKPSPKAYRLLSEIFILPKRKTLSNLLQKVPITPGINDVLFSDLKKKVQKLPAHHRHCSVIFDEMSIAPQLTFDQKKDEIVGFTDDGDKRTYEFCDKVLVFMVRGIIKKFKQPVAYSFSNSSTKAWHLVTQIKNVVKKVQETGLNVTATVCDQGATNMLAINILLKQTRENYLKNGKEWRGGFFEINSKKIVPIYDPPHLIKGIRNNLLTKDLKYTMKGKECTAKWQYIIDVYKRGPGYRGVRLGPKLTAQHVLPQQIPKMKVKYCTQVFSSSVGAAIGHMADVGKLPEDSKGTADLLMLFDDIFDSVNGSSSRIKKGKIYRTAVTPTSPHHKLWQNSLPVIKSMYYVDSKGKTSVVPSLTSWIKTIEGFKIILKDFHKLKLNSILLRNINQDPIENFFGAIRAHGCQNIMPNAAAFQAAFKTLLINNMTSAHSVGANCEKENSRFLLESLEDFIHEFENIENIILNEDILEEHLIIEEIDIDNLIASKNVIDLEKCAALAYCSGWLLTKARKIYKNCEACKKDLEIDEIQEFHKYIEMREYSDKGWLCYPTKKSLNFFAQTENLTNTILKSCPNKKNLIHYIKLIFSVNLDMSFVTCHLHKDEIIKLLTYKRAIFHIFTWCKQINKILVGKEINIDFTDIVQVAAFHYREKNKTKKRVTSTGREVVL